MLTLQAAFVVVATKCECLAWMSRDGVRNRLSPHNPRLFPLRRALHRMAAPAAPAPAVGGKKKTDPMAFIKDLLAGGTAGASR